MKSHAQIQTRILNILAELKELPHNRANSRKRYDLEFELKILSDVMNTRRLDTNEEKQQLIQEIVAEYYGTTFGELLCNRRCRELLYVKARQVIFHQCSRHTKLSLRQIGSPFNKNHSTVHHGIETVENLCGVDRCFRDELKTIESLIAKGLDKSASK